MSKQNSTQNSKQLPNSDIYLNFKDKGIKKYLNIYLAKIKIITGVVFGGHPLGRSDRRVTDNAGNVGLLFETTMVALT